MQGIRMIWTGKEQRSTDTVFPVKDARETDILIPIMGPTGVGKSTFINEAAGADATTVGHGLESCTAAIQHVIIQYPDDSTRRVVFVDTPGFSNTYTDESEILRQIAVWLARSYSDKMKLAGVIYLHEISQARMLGASRKNFGMFNKLIGNDAMRNVILATTKWGGVKKGEGLRREAQLSATFWKEMVEHGSRMARFLNTTESAWKIVNLITEREPLDALQIQKELVDLEKLIPQTEAGSSLGPTLKELVEKRDDADEESLRDSEKQLRSLLGQLQELKVPLGDGGARTGVDMTYAVGQALPLLDQSLTPDNGYQRLYMYTLMSLESYVPSQVDSLRAKYSEWDGDEIAQIIHYDSIMTTLRRYLDQCEVEYHGSSDPALVNRILKLDAQGLATRIRVVSKDRQRRNLLVNLKGSQAQSLLDLLQELLDSFDLGDIRSSLVRIIVALSKNSGVYPTRLTLRNLTIPSGSARAGGSFGDVFAGDLGGQVVAVKIMRVFDPSVVESLFKAYSKEAVLWAQLSSPYVLPFCGVYNITEPSPRIGLVSPWMDHGTLTQYLKNSKQANRLSLMLDVSLGLEYLHSFDPPVIHGDLKGANILITADLSACVADFGLCVLARDSNTQFSVASSSNGKGSTPWMAPELFNDGETEQKRKTCASDIYAYGCVGYEIFSGKPPFADLSSPRVMLAIMKNSPLLRPASAELDDDTWGLIEKCRGVDPGSRPQASEVVQQLRTYPTVCDRKEPVWDQNKSISWRLLSTFTSASLAAPGSEGGPGELRGPRFVYNRRDTSGPSSAEKRRYIKGFLRKVST